MVCERLTARKIYLPCVVGLPGFAGSLGREPLVQADEQVEQLAVHRPDAEQVRQFREIDELLRIPGRPVIVSPVDDPEHLVVRLARLMQQAADLLQCARHAPNPSHSLFAGRFYC